MNIIGYEIPQHVIEKYLRSIKYNQLVGTKESDQSQVDAHLDIIKESGLDPSDPQYDRLAIEIAKLADTLLFKGY